MAAARKASGNKTGTKASKKVTRGAQKKAPGKVSKKAAKKNTAKKNTAKKNAAKKIVAKKSVSKKSTAKSASKKPAAKKKSVAGKVAAVRKTGGKAAGKKSSPKSIAIGKAAPGKTTAGKTASKSVVRKAPAKKVVAKKLLAKKAPAGKTASRKAVSKTGAARKAAASKQAMRKPEAGKKSARKAPARKPAGKTDRKQAGAATVTLPARPAPLRSKAKTSQSRRKAKKTHSAVPASRRLAARTPVGRPSILVGMRAFDSAQRQQLRDSYAPPDLILREVVAADHAAISELLLDAFSGAAEDRLVRELRDGGHLLCEIAAEYEGILAGYAAFAKIGANVDGRAALTAALAPLAVESELRNLGIARRLIVSGLAMVRACGVDGVFVLGDTGFYARLGFSNAMAQKFGSPFPAVHMSLLEFSPGAYAGESGTLMYPAPFDKL